MRSTHYAPAGFLLAIWVAWATDSGGYFASDWYAGSLGAAAILAVLTVGRRHLWPSGRAVGAGLGLFVAWVAFNYLSLLWAGSPGSALEASNKQLLYLLTAWILSLLPWDSRSATTLTGAWSVAIAAVALWSLLSALGADQLKDFLLEWRYQHPIGYSNGAAALAAIGVWPALMLSCRRGLHHFLQGFFLAVAVFLLEFSLLPQSRATVLGLVVAALLFFGLAPDRLRLAARLLVIAGALGLAGPAIFEVYTAGEEGRRVVPILHEAGRQIGLSVLLAAVAGTLIAALERYVHPGERGRVALRRGAAALLAGAVLVVVAIALANSARISAAASEGWDSFELGEPTGRQSESNRLSTLAYNRERADYYRVAVDLFEEKPVGGVGAGNFERRYTAARQEEKHSRYAHSLWLRALSETGVVGLVLYAAMLAVTLAAALFGLRRIDTGARWTVVACLGVVAYFVTHASFDWVDEIPAIGAPSFGLMFVAATLTCGSRKLATSGRWARARLGGRLPPYIRQAAPWAVGGATALLMIPLQVLPYLSVRYNDRALAGQSTSPEQALRDARRAQRLNAIWQVPHLTEGLIAVDLNDDARARSAFRNALDVEDSWYAHFQLALLNAQSGNWANARHEIRKASALNSEDPLVARILKRIARHQTLDAAAVNERIGESTRRNFTTPQK